MDILEELDSVLLKEEDTDSLLDKVIILRDSLQEENEREGFVSPGHGSASDEEYMRGYETAYDEVIYRLDDIISEEGRR